MPSRDQPLKPESPAQETVIIDSFAVQIAYDANDNPEFVGLAAPGSLTSANVWQIKKITYDASDNPTKVEWADGDDSFNNIWDDHASLSYS